MKQFWRVSIWNETISKQNSTGIQFYLQFCRNLSLLQSSSLLVHITPITVSEWPENNTLWSVTYKIYLSSVMDHNSITSLSDVIRRKNWISTKLCGTQSVMLRFFFVCVLCRVLIVFCSFRTGWEGVPLGKIWELPYFIINSSKHCHYKHTAYVFRNGNISCNYNCNSW